MKPSDGEGFNNMLKDTMNVTGLFIFTNNLYLAAITAFNIGHPFRKPFYTNIWFVLNYFLLALYHLLICIFPEIRMPFDINADIPGKFLVELYFWAVLGGFIIFLYERLICISLYNHFAEKKLISEN